MTNKQGFQKTHHLSKLDLSLKRGWCARCYGFVSLVFVDGRGPYCGGLRLPEGVKQGQPNKVHYLSEIDEDERRGFCHFCNRYVYLRRYKGTYGCSKRPPRSNKPLHKLSNIDVKKRKGNCAICGLNIDLYGIKNFKCKNAAIEHHRKNVVKQHGLTPSQCEAMVKQVSQCEICYEPLKYVEIKRNDGIIYKRSLLTVDHCHKTNKIRGVLCNSCNRALGWFKDNPELLQSAFDYLKRYSE